ncbi:MAG TPA: DUF6318 family protein [Kineosporiaceae bacterium]|nr:DUF6318 family protein [Kineosporiaceae bacterium]
MRRSASRRRRIPRLVGVLPVVAALTALTACDSGSGGSPKPPSSTSVTLRPSSSPTSSPTVPSEARQPTRAGAAAFFRYFVSAMNDAYRQLRPEPLAVAALPSCGFCGDLVNDVSAARSAGETYGGGIITIATMVAADGDPASGLMVNAVVDQSAGERRSAAGSVVATYPEQHGLRMDVGLRWVGGEWRVVGVALPKATS